MSAVMGELPGSVLFCCTANALRSPMAEGILKLLHGRRICKPRPLCDRCAVCSMCDYYAKIAKAPSLKGGQGARGKR